MTGGLPVPLVPVMGSSSPPPEVFDQEWPEAPTQPVKGGTECWGNSETELNSGSHFVRENRVGRRGMIDVAWRPGNAVSPRECTGLGRAAREFRSRDSYRARSGKPWTTEEESFKRR